MNLIFLFSEFVTVVSQTAGKPAGHTEAQSSKDKCPMDPRFAALLNRQGGAPADTPAVDTSEQIYISSLALLKMLKHGRAGVPMEV